MTEDGREVRIQKTDESFVKVSLDKLSPEHRMFVTNVENPFEEDEVTVSRSPFEMAGQKYMIYPGKIPNCNVQA